MKKIIVILLVIGLVLACVKCCHACCCPKKNGESEEAED